MNKRTAAQRYLSEWIEILGLSGYTIKMRLHEKLDPYHQSQTDVSEKVMRIDISLNQSLVEIEHSIAHELSHIVIAPTFRAYYALVMGYGKKALAGVMEDYNLRENEVIEQYLRSLYKALGKAYPPYKEGAEDFTVG